MKGAPKLLWEPSETQVADASITRYAEWLSRTRGMSFDSYDELWRWSVEDIEGFWESIWGYFKVHAFASYERVLVARTMPGASWFPGARVNYAAQVFQTRDGSRVAIRHFSENGSEGEITWSELAALTASIAAALRALDIGVGDRVVAYLPNIPETVAAFLACAAVGAIWASCSPEFGSKSVAERFRQIEPAVLLTVDGYAYGGREYDRRDALAELRAALPTVRQIVLLGGGTERRRASAGDGLISWEDFLALGRGSKLEFAAVPFDHPLWVLYSSGTTGLPKAIVHGHGGMMLEGLKTMGLHLDLRSHDRIFWFTTTGWMMWNFLVGALLTEASIVLYDGSAAYPDLGALWRVAERTGVTCFGTGAAYIRACMKARWRPATGSDLSSVRSVGSTGSPLSRDAFEWVYSELGDDIWLFSTSGGTNVCTAFVGGVPTLPVYSGEMQARALGARVEAWDASGRSVVGRVGELVLVEPMPSMPLFLWGDVTGELYRESYFGMYPGVWRHGDWIEISERGTAIISGRSDATINRGGIRIGTSELYRAVLSVDEVLDVLVVDVPRAGNEGYVMLFVVLREGASLEPDLEQRIRTRIRLDCSPRHLPDEVRVVEEVPRTLSGKVLEVPVKRILSGDDLDEVVSRDTLANPRSLAYFERLAAELAALGVETNQSTTHA